ncbi:MAG: cobalamin-binding protein [Desulfovermiculus sp.]
MKRLFAVVLGLVLCWVLVSSQSGAEARTVTDELGRTLELPADIGRIVSLAPSITESVFAVGRGESLVGVTRYSDYPGQAQSLPSVGSYVNLNVEKIVSLQPDLCLATKDGNPYPVIRQLEQAGIPVYALDPRDLPAVMDTLLKLGQLLDAQDKAQEVVAQMRRELQELQALVDQVTDRPKVFFQIGISPIVSVGTDTFIHELITLAGGVNVAAGSVQYPRYSREDVLVFNPDLILINSMSKEEDLVQAEIDRWQEFPQIDAVADSRIHSLDASLFNRPTPRLTRALRTLVHLFHPQVAAGRDILRPDDDEGGSGHD